MFPLDIIIVTVVNINDCLIIHASRLYYLQHSFKQVFFTNNIIIMDFKFRIIFHVCFFIFSIDFVCMFLLCSPLIWSSGVGAIKKKIDILILLLRVNE